MGGFRSSKTLAFIATGAILAYQTAGIHAASEHHQHLRQRNLQSRDYEHVGCFNDDEDDRVLGYKMTDDQLTTESCYDYCVRLGAPLMATQYAKECWCTIDEEVDYERHGEATCDYSCAGDKGEMCGGNTAFDLYTIGSEHGTPEGALEDDIVKIISVEGDNPGNNWSDSYSDGDKCYMETTFDHDIGDFEVDTPIGRMTIRELYDQLKAGPGSNGHPLYNDIQCGNGPANTADDETACPGLVGYGRDGCGQIGPMWDLSELVE